LFALSPQILATLNVHRQMGSWTILYNAPSFQSNGANCIVQAVTALQDIWTTGTASVGSVAVASSTSVESTPTLSPGDQVTRAQSALGLVRGEATEDSTDDLFALDLATLQIPAALAEGRIVVRHPVATELALVTEWSVAFNCEALGFGESAELRRNCAELIGRLQVERAHFVLQEAGTAVAYAAFNAMLPDMVQLGGVWTPPPLRGRGYARNVVAGALLAARATGVKRATLFTENDNYAAQSAYRSLGFAKVGGYGIVIFPESERL